MVKFNRKTREERSLEIIAAGRRAFLANGYRNTTMEDIIEHTSLSKGGVYRYYKSPKEIMMDMMIKGNNFRFSVLEKIKENVSKEASIEEVLTLMLLNKIYDKNIDKKIYAMFITEMIYDKDMKDLFYKLEAESKDMIISMLSDKLSKKNIEYINKNYLFFSRALNTMILMTEIFDDNELLKENEDRVKDLIHNLLKDIE